MSGKGSTQYLSTHGVVEKVSGRGKHGLPAAEPVPKKSHNKIKPPGSVRPAGSGVEDR